jgi:hypothetical protein
MAEENPNVAFLKIDGLPPSPNEPFCVNTAIAVLA